MFVETRGNGQERYLCLHGWSGDHGSFRSLVERMPEAATLLCADLPGCGRSSAPDAWSLGAISEEIALTIGKTGGVTLIGHCIGALIGLCAAKRRPDLFTRLILIDAFASWPWYFRVFTNPVWGDKAYATTFGNPAGRWITNKALARRRAADSDLTEGFQRAQQDVQLRYLHLLAEIEGPEQFESLQIPIDIVYGARTFGAVRESAATWQRIWPHAHVHELRDAGHMPLLESPQALSAIVFGEPCIPLPSGWSNTGI